MDTDNQLKSDRERLSGLISKYTGIPAKRVYGFIAENGAGKIMSSANMLAKTDAQREKIISLIEFKNLYEIVKGADNKVEHVLSSTESAKGYFIKLFADKNDKERVAAVFLDSANKITATKIMSAGSVNESAVNSREITREALFHNAVAVILAHNHPSGIARPSSSDELATDRVEHSLSAVGVKLHDHIIVVGDSAISMADSGGFNFSELVAEMSKAASPAREAAEPYIKREKSGVNNTMSGNTTGGGGRDAPDAPIAENKYVKELLGILRDNGKDTSGLTALIGHCCEMENFVKLAEDRIADMKSQLDSMQDAQDHPIKTAMQKTIKALETAVAQVRAQLRELKAGITDGCKNAISAFKEKGASALDRLASFFNIKSGLQNIKNSTIKSIDRCDKSIAQVEDFSKQFHASNRAVKNMARILVGKKPIDAAREPGRIARAVNAPTRAHKACMLAVKRQAGKMIGALDKLERGAEASRGNRAAVNLSESAAGKKPTLMERLEAKKTEIKQRELEKPPMERAPKSQGLEV